MRKYLHLRKHVDALTALHLSRFRGNSALMGYVCSHRDCPDLRMDELKPFSVPPWMLEKMQRAMEAQREADL